MGREKKRKRNSIVRIIFVAISVLFQVGWLLLLVLELNRYSTWISLCSVLLGALVVLRLYSKNTNSAMKMSWILLILVFPVMGLSLYLLFVVIGDSTVTKKKLAEIRGQIRAHQLPEGESLEKLGREDLSAANSFRCLQRQGWPVWENTRVRYFARGASAFEAMKEDLEQARDFIFMEYFIVEEDESFREIRQILARKAKEGVQVRLMYDDIGSIGYVNFRFARELNQEGICCKVFNPAVPVVNMFMNHRDHRKITVIDGKVGYTGGYNLANEYFDRSHPYGDWKDTGLRLEGQAVHSLTAAFLELWNLVERNKEDYGRYLGIVHTVSGEGYVQPYADDPLGTERVTENVYLNLISQAKEYVYFTTPYLIITDEIARALQLAAKRGGDVRIITPGIPDKKTVYKMTRSYYGGLVSQGVRIFEYTPGFCHAKQCLCDGSIASIGTSNLDYRSLYHHFENNVLLYGCDALEDMARDFEALFPQCEEVTEKYRTGRGGRLLIWQCVLRLFAPLV